MDKDIPKDKDFIKIRNKFQDKKAIRGDITTKRSITMRVTIFRGNMKIKVATKKRKDSQIRSPTMKVVEEMVEDVEEVKIDLERNVIEIIKNEKSRRKKKLKRSIGDNSA